MGSLVELIVDKYDGSLKAEHGTGLNMAPYLEREWGPKATELMWRIKRLADPDGVLAPGVILNRDPAVHLRNLQVDAADRGGGDRPASSAGCASRSALSRNTTTTPRQRILLRREMARQPEGSPVLESLLREYEHDAIQTCAADGSCGPACPLAIDTGKLVKRFRALEHDERAERVAERLAARDGLWSSAWRAGARRGTAAAASSGGRSCRAAARRAGGRSAPSWFPSWPPNMPAAGPGVAAAPPARGSGRRLHAGVHQPHLREPAGRGAARRRCPRRWSRSPAGRACPLWIPDDVAGNCCATPWSSKGYGRGPRADGPADGGGVRPAVDGGGRSAVGRRRQLMRPGAGEGGGPGARRGGAPRATRGVEVLDSIEWAHDRLLPALDVDRRVASVAVHPTCSADSSDSPAARALARGAGRRGRRPGGAGCCGMAGRPRPPPSRAARLGAARRGRRARRPATSTPACASNRTCEIGLQQDTGRPFESVRAPAGAADALSGPEADLRGPEGTQPDAVAGSGPRAG